MNPKKASQKRTENPVATTSKGDQGQASQKKQQKKKVKPSIGDGNLKVRILEQDKQIATLQEKVRILEQTVVELSGMVNQRTPLKVLGLTVTQKLDIVKGRRYRRWYAIYRENGTRRLIYIGKDINRAEEKIQAWLEKNRSQQ